MTEIQTALLKCLHHWDDNVKSYPWRAGAAVKYKWFYANAVGEQCALCQIRLKCNGCILNDAGDACCKEWLTLAEAILDSTSCLHHVESVRDRLKAECEKEGLI